MERLEQLRKLAAASPNDPFVHYGIGLACVNEERWNEALEAFDRTLDLDPDYHAAHLQQARVHLKLGQRAEARAALEAGMAAAQRLGDTHAADEMGKLRETLD